MFSYSEFIHHYPNSYFNHKEPISADYRVFVNGKEIPVYTCRISKYPFNRVWTGHQRQIEQTELASFINLVSDEELRLEVIPNRNYEKAFIKPYSKGIAVKENEGKISFTLRENGQYVLETDSYHHCLYIFNSKPIEAPKEEDVTYYFGAGIHFPGKITMRSNESMYVDKDALVFGCVFAENAENIHIFGNGLLDDSGEERVNIHCYEPYTNGNMKFYDCKNVKIEGVLLRNSAIWCLNFFHCFDAVVDGIQIFGQWRYNTDGIDIVNSQRITIKNSFIHSFDDTVTIKGIDRFASTDNCDILTENCILWCDWGRTCEVGLETACRYNHGIVFRDCDILRAGCVALDIQNGDCAEIYDILFENIRVEYNAFDTKEVLQRTDEQVYDAENTIAVPTLLYVGNPRFRSKATSKQWETSEKLLCELDLSDIQCAAVHDVICRNITVYYDERIPKKDGKYNVPIRIVSTLPNVKHENILVSDVRINGELLTEENAILDLSGAENFRLENTSEFDEIAKNTVKAENQLKENEFVTFEKLENEGLRVLFLGNSITRHGIKEEIGWYSNCGMAASAKEKDYVHILMKKTEEKTSDPAFCICQAAAWERDYRNGAPTYPLFQSARDFSADVIVMRLIENCSTKEFDGETFKKELWNFLSFLNPTGKAKIVLTTGFWKHPGDRYIRELSKEKGLPLTELGDLGADVNMKAIGLFAHDGVANHPGDLGMETIAKRIFEILPI